MLSYRADLQGRRVGVWGLRVEGLAVVRAAVESGATSVVGVDSSTVTRPAELPADIVEFHAGDDALSRFFDCDVVFLSPGIPWRHDVAVALRESAGVTVSSATDLFLSVAGAQTVGVTGTKGKSTTSSFLAHLLTVVGARATVAGNIGIPLVQLEPADDEIVVAEMSSQQCAVLRHSPQVAVVTNLGEDHLDWHGDVDEYVRAKSRIFESGSDVLICESRALARLRELSATAVDVPDVVLSEDAAADRWPTVGIDANSPMSHPHNRVNGLLALLAAEWVLGRSIGDDELLAAMNTFGALPHRLEVVRQTAGRTWVDDTLATTADSVVAAMRALRSAGPTAVIVGGLDRGIDYTAVDDYLAEHPGDVHLVQIPSNGHRIGERYAAEHHDFVSRADSLADAVAVAARLPVSSVVLSPAAPSYDMYRSYKAKAADFVECIDALGAVIE
ncbi:UDP-N-acetylmuramoylalanine--D-glutamate ligase [Gordonia malaquae]|uniref:UDP-N-acetylmuramoylalanine--D-glutamate ligase n=1 Tax=Gordonia malaquae NBRC 108250 TaxID=1223542 RepID=M3VBC8_GORML|nr:UDP-N-acetylmuramoyl-L-alanine--D-glutamate ligase [Gordonia malaquae]GAC80038.1 UDP-N-acetylmuramoylalanine--D-glutamate ligase [Gordonia malaquae NBRC 108250]SEC33846.1 UDP-N-acetylmuramoylalanine--D-glutamate ligase [Gordonia malaquae]